MKLFIRILAIMLAFTLVTIILVQQRPMYKDIVGVMMRKTETYTDVLVSGVRNHYCQVSSLETEVMTPSGEWTKATKSTFLSREGKMLTLDEQRIKIDQFFVRLGRIMPASDHVKIYVNAQCYPFINRRQLIIDIENKLPQ